MQTAVYATSLDSLSSPAATTQVSINFGETVEIPLIRQAWKWITQYHGLLRSSFKRPAGGALTLREHDDCEIAWRSLDWTKVPEEEIAAKWQQLQLDDAAEAIDLTKPPLYRFHVIQLPGSVHHFLWTFHSILLDEESVYLVFRDWLRIYNLLCKGQEPASPQGTLSYAGIIGSIEGVDSEAAVRHWKDIFQDFSCWAPLRSLYSGKTPSSHIFTTTYTELFDRTVTARLNELATSANASFLTLLTAAWGLVLARTNIDTDAIFGIYRSCRSLAGSQATEAVGLFESLLPIRIKVPEDLTCQAWLRQLQEKELASSPFLLTHMEEVWTHANLHGNLPRFDSTLHYLPMAINDRIPMEMPEWMRFDTRLHKTSSFPIRVIARGEERLSITLEYNPHQILPSLARQLFDRLVKVIRSFEENPHLSLSQISITLPDEAENLFRMGGSPLEPSVFSDLYASLDKVIHQHTDLPAVEKEGDSLSFSLLDTSSRQLAAFLQNHFQQSGTVIALAMPLSPHMLISLLGILRSGCVCLAIDPSVPPTDLKAILTRYKVAAVLTDSNHLPLFEKIQPPILILDRIWNEITSFVAEQPLFCPQPSDPALFLLQPDGKRILVSHGMLQVSLGNAIKVYHTKPGDRILCHSLQGSAASIEECFISILTGATLVIPGKNVKSTRTAFQETVESRHITHLRITSAFWSQWVHYLNELSHLAPSGLRRVLIEAGHISHPVIEGWKELNKGGTECIVFYSPSGLVGAGIATEGTSAPELSEEGLVCGQPQPGTMVFLSDRHHRLVPPFFPGILLLGEPNTPYENPQDKGFITITTDSYAWKVSSTEERARWNGKGELILISQPHTLLPKGFTWIKLRRIEEALTSHPDLIDAIVRRSPSDENLLFAWIVPRDSHGQFPTALENHLRDRLPKDWVPTQFAFITRFNLNAFDQIDPDSLPEPKPAPLPKPKPPTTAAVLVSPSASPNNVSPITTLRTGIVDTALYFVHAGRGLVEDYRPVVQALSGGYAVHCLMVPRGRLALSSTVEEITRQLLPSFRLHVSGKFAVVGIGTGAIFAWELARQLDQANEKDVPFILFEAPPAGRKESSYWLQKLKKALLRNQPASYSPQGRLAELIAAYQPPVLQRKPYFFVSGKPDPEWRRRAPLGIWGQLRLTGISVLDEPGEIAGALRDVLSSLDRNKKSSFKKHIGGRFES